MAFLLALWLFYLRSVFFLFALWLFYLCCGFLFALWLFYLCCGFLFALWYFYLRCGFFFCFAPVGHRIDHAPTPWNNMLPLCHYNQLLTDIGTPCILKVFNGQLVQKLQVGRIKLY